MSLTCHCFAASALDSVQHFKGQIVQLAVDAMGAATATESAAPASGYGAVPKTGVVTSL